MASFGQTKNNMQKLKNYLTKMQFFSTNGQKVSLKDLQQQNLRSANNQLFLPLINFIMLQYSADLYMKILDRVPNLKFLPDKNFIQNVINIAREILKLQVSLTADQFLTNKFFQKKLQFISNIAKAVYQREQATKKGKSKSQSVQPPLQQKLKQLQMNYSSQVNQLQASFDDFEQQQPMEINAVPQMIDFQSFNKKVANQFNKQQKQTQNKFAYKPTPNKMPASNFSTTKTNKTFKVQGQQFNQNQILRALEQRHPTPVLNMRRPADEPVAIVSDRNNKNGSRTNMSYKEQNEQEQDQEQITYAKYKLQQTKNKHKNNNQHQPHPNNNTNTNNQINTKTKYSNPNQKSKKSNQQQQNIYDSLASYAPASHNNCVSKQQFNQLLNLVKVVSQTVNQLSMKFGNLQANINAQIKNLDGKVMIMESSVRLIKDNL